jgi:hypothetical protein
VNRDSSLTFFTTAVDFFVGLLSAHLRFLEAFSGVKRPDPAPPTY